MVRSLRERTVLWLRTDKRGFNLITRNLDLLRSQDINIIVPRKNKLPNASVAVFHSVSDPEFLYYSPVLEKRKIPLIVEENPRKALALSILYPKGGFNTLSIGLDPGNKSCGVVVLGDGIVFDWFKKDCNEVGRSIKEFLAEAPATGYRIFLGDGEGFISALKSLEENNLRYTIVEETYTTSSPSRSRIERVLRDKDILAGYTIAVRGGYSVSPVFANVHRGNRL